MDVFGRIFIGWSVFWLLLSTLLFSVNSVANPENFLSDDASFAVEALGYAWAATIPVTFVVAIWDGIVRRGGGLLTAILIVVVYVGALLTTAADPGSDDSIGVLAGVGAVTLGWGALGGLLRFAAAKQP